MPLVFAPTTPIPLDDRELRTAYWYAVWDHPIAVPLDLRPGGSVYLYDDRTDTIVWSTTVTDTIAVPYEHLDDFRSMLERRWHQPATELADAPLPGFAIAWRAEPHELLLTPQPADAPPLENWDATGHLDPAVAAAWGLEADIPCLTCAAHPSG